MNSARILLGGTSARRNKDVTCHSCGYANAIVHIQLIIILDLSQKYGQVTAILSEGTLLAAGS